MFSTETQFPAPPPPMEGVHIEPWPSELPLFVMCAITSIFVWLFLTVTVFGLFYVVIIGAVLLFMQASFMAHIRGSGVRLGPDQFPELYARVRTIATRLGLEELPDAYLMQAGGSLNALATRFLGRHLIVLYSDLLEACGDDQAAADMIIAHELGHIKAGHLKHNLWLFPALAMPFPGLAYSRAREYTCDRYGLAGAGDRAGALLGLTILAAGGAHARKVNLPAFVQQRDDLNTGWMRIGEWSSTHPPLARRVVALDPALARTPDNTDAGTWRALGILASGAIGMMLTWAHSSQGWSISGRCSTPWG
jgi:Zn-dependent protease with chaperone function